MNCKTFGILYKFILTISKLVTFIKTSRKNKTDKQQATRGLAIAGLTCISSALVLLSAAVRAEKTLINFFIITSALIFLIGLKFRQKVLEFPAIAKPCSLVAILTGHHFCVSEQNARVIIFLKQHLLRQK